MLCIIHDGLKWNIIQFNVRAISQTRTNIRHSMTVVPLHTGGQPPAVLPQDGQILSSSVHLSSFVSGRESCLQMNTNTCIAPSQTYAILSELHENSSILLRNNLRLASKLNPAIYIVICCMFRHTETLQS